MPGTAKLAKALSDVGDGSIVLIETAIEKAPDVALNVLKVMTKKGFGGIVVSASRPYSNLVPLYEKSGIDTKKLLIIDCVTKASSVEAQKAENAVYLDSVSDLTSMSLAIWKAIEEGKGQRFLFLDSISTMLIYNKPDIFAKFIHLMLTKLRVSGVGGALISFESAGNREVRAEIVQLCDRVVKV